MNLHQLLEQAGLSYETLSADERATLNTWLADAQNREITITGVKDHLKRLIEALEREICGLDAPKGFWDWITEKRQDRYRKARLRNYLVLYDLLVAPDRAKAFIEQRIQSLTKKG